MANVTNSVTYNIALIPENAEKIDQINRIILGESYTEAAPAQTPSKVKPSTKEAKKAEDDIVADNQKSAAIAKAEAEESTPSLTLEDLKKAAKKAKADHGEEFTMQVLKDANIEVAPTLGRSMSKVGEGQYAEIIEAWEAGPQATEQAADEPEDDDFEDDLEEDTSEVTADAVKTALKAYAKEVGRDEAKEIMNKHGASALSKVDDCSAKQLSAMFSELVI